MSVSPQSEWCDTQSRRPVQWSDQRQRSIRCHVHLATTRVRSSARATTSPVVGGVTSLVRTTDGGTVGGGQSNSGPAIKTFVDAKIIIGPDGVNLIRSPYVYDHRFRG